MKPLFAYILFSLSLLAAPLLEPLPEQVGVDPAKAKLGKELFYDPILSRDGTVSCATCHDLENGGDDGLPTSFGIKGRKGTINAPTVLNALFNFRQFWDGRARDLKEQAAGPITNPVEMANDFDNLVQTLKKSPYRERFQKIYENGVTKENILDAIAAFEKTLLTPSPYDRYLRGDTEALNEMQKEGLKLFQEKGCIVCHHGINLGGTMYSRFGVLTDVQTKDLGRYNVTKNPEDKYQFKVPTLRNVALTAPYFHDGRTNNLHEAVAIMANVQTGRAISDEEIDKIVAFLTALTGELPEGAKP